MARTTYQVSLTSPSQSGFASPPFQESYPVRLFDGSLLELPIQPLPGGERAIALLMSNQTQFSVEDRLITLLAQLARPFAPEVIVGIPTLGLDYARLVARALGFTQYAALGNTRKFWYNDKLSVPVHSVTSPGANKRLYIDPAIVDRVAGKRTLIVDDVINTGGSAAAAIELLAAAGATVVGLGVVLIEGDAWKPLLTSFSPSWPDKVKGLGTIPIFRKGPGGWFPMETAQELARKASN
jgi:adenine/guanine phosphoribosyltransferase-like PRPP-binding protein